jgi:hypothetical protein
MIISGRQQTALVADYQARFETRMVAHLRNKFPAFASQLERDLRAFIKRGVARADTHGLISEYDVSVFIGLMCVLAPDFDANPTFAWAGDLLGDPEYGSPGVRLENVCALAEEKHFI